MRHWLWPAIVNLVLVLLVIGTAEVWARLAHAPVDHKSYRLTRPLPYRDSTYYSAEFVEESFRQPGWYTPPGSKLILPKEFSGKYFNVRDGLRVTVGQPKTASRRILVFGGSTIYSSEVPDGLTIPSLLQLKLNERGFTRIAVLNYGTTSITSAQQLERLRGTELASGDTVVFFDGDNDVIQGIFYAHPEGSIVEENRRRPAFQKLLVRAAEFSELARYVLNKMQENFVPAHVGDPAVLRQLVDATAVQFRDNVLTAADYTEQHGAGFFHALQPNIFTLARRSAYEKKLLGSPIVPRGFDIAFAAAYPRFRAMFAQVEFRHEDWSDAFDTIDTAVYLDPLHVTERANDIIAERMFTVLADRERPAR